MQPPACAAGPLKGNWANRDRAFIFFEFKVGEVVQSCICEGLGQLLEYLHFSQEDRVKKLIIVSPSPIDQQSRRFLECLRQKFHLLVWYMGYDRRSRRLHGREY